MPVRICQACGAGVPEGARFCPKCGKEAAVRACQACGAQVPEGARFCPKCGRGTVSPPSSPPPPPPPHRRRPLSKSGIAALVVLTLVVVIALVYFNAFDLNLFSRKGAPPQTITATENAALWAKANTALAGFLGEGFKSFDRDKDQPATEKELAPLSGYINDFSEAVKAIKRVTPPPEQSITHWALLPVYQEMPACLAGIRDALLAGDPWAADLEWHKLALLLDEVGGDIEILTLEPTPTTTPTPTPSPTPTPTPNR